MRHLWFKARAYGWGWTHISIEGWLVVLGFLVLLLVSTGFFLQRLRSVADVRTVTVFYIGWVAFLSVAMIVIAWLTGERPRWRWGSE